MIVRATGAIQPGLFLITLGSSCHYLYGAPDLYVLFDPGLSTHIPYLLKRIEALGFEAEGLRAVYITHGHAERIGGLPALFRERKDVTIKVPNELLTKLAHKTFLQELCDDNQRISQNFPEAHESPLPTPQDFIDLLPRIQAILDGDLIQLFEEYTLRAFTTQGHTKESTSYYLQPSNFLICDETFGYVNGRELIAPGGEYSIEAALASIDKLNNLELAGLCLPNGGAITGSILRKHLADLKINIHDLLTECKKAQDEGVSPTEIALSIRKLFYTSADGDRFVQHLLSRTYEGVWKQIEQKASATS